MDIFEFMWETFVSNPISNIKEAYAEYKRARIVETKRPGNASIFTAITVYYRPVGDNEGAWIPYYTLRTDQINPKDRKNYDIAISFQTRDLQESKIFPAEDA